MSQSALFPSPLRVESFAALGAGRKASDEAQQVEGGVGFTLEALQTFDTGPEQTVVVRRMRVVHRSPCIHNVLHSSACEFGAVSADSDFC